MVKLERHLLMRSALQASYDSISDVLYFSLGVPIPNEAVGVADGIELAFALATGDPCGGAVVGYRLYDWPLHHDRLAVLIGRHLAIAPDEVEAVVRQPQVVVCPAS